MGEWTVLKFLIVEQNDNTNIFKFLLLIHVRRTKVTFIIVTNNVAKIKENKTKQKHRVVYFKKHHVNVLRPTNNQVNQFQST